MEDQREIKYRAWDKETNRMWYSDFHYNNSLSSFFREIKLSFVLQQFTGLKDRRGKEIYEGDIVKIITKEWNSDSLSLKDKKYWKSEIVWIKCSDLTHTKAYFDLDAKNMWDNGCSYEDYSDDWDEKENIEVVGNIYENPELLKEKRD